ARPRSGAAARTSPGGTAHERRACERGIPASNAAGAERPGAQRQERGSMSGVDDAVSGNVVIVTGASKGVGRGIALHLARSGATLVITARRPEALDETAAELEKIG